MSIMLGNLSVKQITERLGIEIAEDERKVDGEWEDICPSCQDEEKK
jgi:hypothetical protein